MQTDLNKKSKRSDDSDSSAKLLQKLVLVMSLKIHTNHTKQTVLDLCNVCSNHAPLNDSGQESVNNLQFMILTYL